MKKINTNGDCKPDLHYMVNIESRLKAIRAMVHNRDYFTISRAAPVWKDDDIKGTGALSEQ